MQKLRLLKNEGGDMNEKEKGYSGIWLLGHK